ncbi:hypothetical protein [Enterobacter sp. RHBSTW-00175]|uniref:hypothetical protein n=1 Tax=Enterobacter sp. RHBSTW-00175 TaxID=2742639 RepID=UPI0015EA45BE|nr:hypothetical protein [Enterobacter sp. RHBSTW-00175]QMR78127.1 hypothetical protein HV107_22085 [Enterobacter sp. RHBSTW-00175]
MNTEHNQATQKGKGNKDTPASKRVMFSTRLDESLHEAVRVLSFQHRKSRQENTRNTLLKQFCETCTLSNYCY